MQKNWNSSVGLTFTIIPREIAEEVQIGIPALDYHFTRKIDKGFSIDGRISSQVLQNQISLGPRWACVLGRRWSFSLGDDIAWWYGALSIEGFKTTANGWMNYPNLSIGYRTRKGRLVTLKSELLVNLYYHSNVADEVITYGKQKVSGWAASLLVEQRIYKNINFILGFRAIYTSFYWQTWSIYDTQAKKLYYPEIILGFIL